MNKFTGLFIVLAIFSTEVFSSNLPDAILHMPVPLISGGHTSLADYKGKKPVYIRFWASW